MNNKILVALGWLFFVACGGGSGNGTPPVSEVEEGTGPTLDITRTSDVESYVKTILEGLENSFDSAEDGNTSQSSSVIPMALIVKSASQNSDIDQICNNGGYSRDINVTLNGYNGGTATVTGDVNATRQGDTVSGSLDLDGIFENYSITSSLYLTGTAHADADEAITQGLNYICSNLQNPSSFVFEGSGSANYSGAFTVSGSIGGAISFNYTVAVDLSSESDNGYSNISVNGTAEVSSGGNAITCSVGRDSDPDTDIDNYQITCQ